MAEVQTADESGDTQEHGGQARGWRWRPEMFRSDFEKIKAKDIWKKDEGAAEEADERWIYRK
jgi:hypothetical protein